MYFKIQLKSLKNQKYRLQIYWENFILYRISEAFLPL